MTEDFSVGQRIGGYTIKRLLPLENLRGQYLELRHEATGARHIHLAVPDDNNAFSVFFPTIPSDSTGVAHILEHIVLTGSERFPVRDPFFAMTSRSLSTFMNAMTASDWTTYPFSTRNATDYQNLLEVYLDAAFFPRLSEPSFRQEGHRLEFATLDDPNSPLEFKGVVFNEMKGAGADPRRRMFRLVGQAVFPALTYANDAGGDPTVIPNLTYEDLKAFHARHYHPSNALFYTYGNLPLEGTLRTIEERVLSRFERLDADMSVPDQSRFSSPVELRGQYSLARSESLDKKAQVLLAWATSFIGDSFRLLALRVLEAVLLSNAASPLRKALLESGLGEALADGTGLQDSFREAVFAAGLKGVNASDAEQVENLILSTLRELAEKGVDPKMVDASVHRLEIESREVSNAGFPYALRVFLDVAAAALHGGDPYASLQFATDVERLERERQQGPFFENLIREYFLDNPHRARVVLEPDYDLADREAAAERAHLDEIRATLSEARVAEIVAEALRLKELQETPDDPNVLPTLELSDVPTSLEEVPYERVELRGATVGLCPQPTNGLTYIDVQADTSGLPDRLKDLLPVFAFVVPRMGAGASDYLEMATRIDANTGGIDGTAGTRLSPTDLSRFSETLTISGKALARNHEPFVAILRDLLSGVTFDRKHLVNLLGQLRARLEANVIQAGHIMSLRLAAGRFGGRDALRDRLEGIAQVQTVKRLTALDEEGISALIGDLEAIRDHLFRAANLRVCVTSEEERLPELRRRIDEDLLAAIPADRAPATPSSPAAANLQAVARTTAVPVAFDAKVVKTVPYESPDAAPLVVLANLLKDRFLHPQVREKGGAYGGFAVADAEGAIFGMVSYRDPHITRTFRVFEEAAGYLASGDLDPVHLKEAILAASQGADPLLSPDTKGRTRFFGDLNGYTLEVRTRFKRGLLETTAADLERVAAYLKGEASLAVISSEEKVREANSEMGGIFQSQPI